MIADWAGFVALAGLMVGLIAWLRADMNRRMDRLETRMDRVEVGVNDLRERVARLETGQDELRGRMDRIETRMDRFENRMDRIETRMERLESGQSEFRERVARIDGQLDAMPAAVGRAVADAIGKPRTRRARFERAPGRTATG